MLNEGLQRCLDVTELFGLLVELLREQLERSLEGSQLALLISDLLIERFLVSVLLCLHILLVRSLSLFALGVFLFARRFASGAGFALELVLCFDLSPVRRKPTLSRGFCVGGCDGYCLSNKSVALRGGFGRCFVETVKHWLYSFRRSAPC